MNENNNFEIIRNISTYVTDWLREEIRSGSFGKDGYLPSEEELCQKIGVSRPTIRTALATLSAEGYLIRKQGNGTFVNSRGLEVLSYQTTWEFTQLIGASGRKASINTFLQKFAYQPKMNRNYWISRKIMRFSQSSVYLWGMTFLSSIQ